MEKIKIKYKIGDKVRITKGMFKGIEKKITEFYINENRVVFYTIEDESLKLNELMEDDLELVEEEKAVKMDIREVLKIENVGKVFKDDKYNLEWRLEQEDEHFELYFNGSEEKETIGVSCYTSEILNFNFREISTYKKINIEEAIKRFLEGEVVYKKYENPETKRTEFGGYRAKAKEGRRMFFIKLVEDGFLKMQWYKKLEEEN